MCNETNNKYYGLVTTAVNELRQRKVYIIDSIIVLFYQCFYNIGDIGSLIHPQNAKVVLVWQCFPPIDATYNV